MENQQWEYCYLDVSCSNDNNWMCKITYFSPTGIILRELPTLKKSRSENTNPYYKIIGILGMHGWEAISINTSSSRNSTASGYFKRLVFQGRKIDDLQVML
ncbi:MAG: hypothetical protein QME45_03835 [Clostridiales bacterium]|nr:hypothetical protein [Clostridiales bacterium]HBM80927.1 hypothetical protein [Clostridiaceae bacterium]